MKTVNSIAPEVLSRFRKGTAIPAQVLALDENRQFAPRYQRALCRYFIDAGVGGIAVGVHSTQFAIRDPKIGLFEPVLSQTAEFIDQWCAHRNTKILKVGGVCGKTDQALKEAQYEAEHGYDAALLSLAALKDESIQDVIDHCRKISEVMPIIGFYLQPTIGGRPLPYDFWRQFVTIENVLAIKVAPFNRYASLDVVRALAESGRQDITLYTGNDDNLLIDLLTEYNIGGHRVRFKGGLLGHWSCWTRKAVELLEEVHKITDNNLPIPPEMLTRAAQITDSNAAIFDAANKFAGCIPGLHEILHRQGILPGIWCLDPQETLSPGQAEEITRVHDTYPHLHDDDFVQQHIHEWFED